MTLALNKELAKRDIVLLRASSKQQTDREHDFDIPQQKSILLPFGKVSYRKSLSGAVNV